MSVSLLDLQFVAILGALVLSRLIVPSTHHLVCGLIGSAALIGAASVQTLILITGISVLYVFPLTILLRDAARRKAQPGASKTLLLAGVCGLVLIMVGFKTYRFFALPFTGTPEFKFWINLAGFSYFLFKAINIVFIHYLSEVRGSTLFTILYYALFPPTITSGPIQKYADFVAQVRSPTPLTMSVVGEGSYRILRGYFRKLVLAWLMDLIIQRLLVLPEFYGWHSILLVSGLYLYFYFDFAGYSDIAVGFGLLFGIRVPENFRRPFAATSVTEFWRNWHITLADWFRDHVFIPLGGMRKGGARAALLSFLIMCMCGFWHGCTWMFLFWGMWHGTILLVEGLTNSRPMPPAFRHGPRYWGRVLWTNARVAAGALFFLPNADGVSRILVGLTRWW